MPFFIKNYYVQVAASEARSIENCVKQSALQKMHYDKEKKGRGK